ncbi:uncharacterized protein N7511_008591 [Penicillium nucicola]|uniref:uncharacterized protein n=1 Tax=Penicillium nucicola TaxID=1850975 RepID=UPI00254548CD|nr:uncharacterized protein N7511_008591 [Penicillium nucicola]KAJ5746895.1 hypothetical protein N7511_008591 [Penicillium nucicola]
MRHRSYLGSLNRQRSALLVAVVVLFVIFEFLLPSTRPDARFERSQDRPWYLHQSPFRTNPNYEYEIKISNALHDLEIEGQLRGDIGAPDTVWQIMLMDNDKRGEDSLQFEKKNAEWNYSLVNAKWADKFITETLASIPDLEYLYKSYPGYVLRGDLLRYLILWYHGGYYADIDVYPATSIKTCPAMQNTLFNQGPNTAMTNRNISLVVGIEIDEPFASTEKMHDWHWVRRYGFLQYTMYAPQRFSPILREVIVRVLSHTKQHIAQSHIWGARYNEMTTLEITGPGVFTDTVLDILSETLPSDHRLIQKSMDADEELGDLISSSSALPVQRVTWAPFHQLQETLCVDESETSSGKMLGGLCVLPLNAWGNGQRHSGSEGFNSHHACINHRFGGTWKPWRQSWRKWLFG